MLKMKAEKISDEVSFEIYFRRIEESKVSRNHSIYFKWKFLGYFFFWKVMIGIELKRRVGFAKSHRPSKRFGLS